MVVFSLAHFAQVTEAPEEKELNIEHTLSMIKPDAVEHNQLGAVEEYFEDAVAQLLSQASLCKNE